MGLLASFTQLLFKRGCQHDPCYLGDLLRVGLPLRSAKSPKGLRRMPTLCGVPYGQMAKVERRETVLKVPEVSETWPHEATKRHCSACFRPAIRAIHALGALLEPLFRQFRDGVLGSSSNTISRKFTFTI
jgi:hypothetical protein